MRNEIHDPLFQHEIQERFAQQYGLFLQPLNAEIFADDMLEAHLDLTKIQGVAVLGSYVKPNDPDDPNSPLTLSSLTQGRLEAGVFCLRPWMSLVTCGRNPENIYPLSDAEVLAKSAVEEYRIENPIIVLPQGFTTAGEMIALSQTARDNRWANVLVVTNSAFIERTASMAYTLKSLDIDLEKCIAVESYLIGLWERLPERRTDVDDLFLSFYSLMERPYRGAFTFVCPAGDRGKPIHIDRFGQEMQGVYQWRKGTYR